MSRCIDRAEVAELRASLATFEDWDTPEIDVYNNDGAAGDSAPTIGPVIIPRKSPKGFGSYNRPGYYPA